MTTKKTKEPKKAPKIFTFEDFMTKTNNEQSTKMDLLFDKVNTGCYLMVKGIEAKSIQRSRIVARVKYADLADDLKLIEDKVERANHEKDEKEAIEIGLALDLIDGWSFGEMDGKQKLVELLLENQGLAFGVIAHATTPDNYLAK